MPEGTNWIDLLDVAGNLTAAVVTLLIAWQVHRYTRRKDKAAVIQAMWQQQQDWNCVAAGSPAHARAVEQMVYGYRPRDEEERLALNSCVFFFLNRINHVWDAVQQGIMTEAEFVAEIMPNLKLLAGQKELVKRLLQERGYDDVFDSKVVAILDPLPVTGSVDVFGTSEHKAPIPTDS